MPPRAASPSRTPLTFESLRRPIHELGIGCGGRPPRPIERYPQSLRQVVHNAACKLAGPCNERSVLFVAEPGPRPTLVIDPWRIELGLLAPSLAALAWIESGGLIRICAERRGSQFAVHWEVESRRLTDRVSRRVAEAVGQESPEPDDWSLALHTALRVASDHGGRLQIACSSEGRTRLSLVLGEDPEIFLEPWAEPKGTSVFLLEHPEVSRARSVPENTGTWLANRDPREHRTDSQEPVGREGSLIGGGADPCGDSV